MDKNIQVAPSFAPRPEFDDDEADTEDPDEVEDGDVSDPDVTIVIMPGDNSAAPRDPLPAPSSQRAMEWMLEGFQGVATSGARDQPQSFRLVTAKTRGLDTLVSARVWRKHHEASIDDDIAALERDLYGSTSDSGDHNPPWLDREMAQLETHIYGGVRHPDMSLLRDSASSEDAIEAPSGETAETRTFLYVHSCGQEFLPFTTDQIGGLFVCPGCHSNFELVVPANVEECAEDNEECAEVQAGAGPDSSSEVEVLDMGLFRCSTGADGYTDPDPANLPQTSRDVFFCISAAVASKGAELAQLIDFSFSFLVAGERWSVVLHAGEPTVVARGSADKADAKLKISEQSFIDVMTGSLEPLAAFGNGELSVVGNTRVVHKLKLLQMEVAWLAMGLRSPHNTERTRADVRAAHAKHCSSCRSSTQAIRGSKRSSDVGTTFAAGANAWVSTLGSRRASPLPRPLPTPLKRQTTSPNPFTRWKGANPHSRNAPEDVALLPLVANKDAPCPGVDTPGLRGNDSGLPHAGQDGLGLSHAGQDCLGLPPVKDARDASHYDVSKYNHVTAEAAVDAVARVADKDPAASTSFVVTFRVSKVPTERQSLLEVAMNKSHGSHKKKGDTSDTLEYVHSCGQSFLPFCTDQVGMAFHCPGCKSVFTLPSPPPLVKSKQTDALVALFSIDLGTPSKIPSRWKRGVVHAPAATFTMWEAHFLAMMNGQLDPVDAVRRHLLVLVGSPLSLRHLKAALQTVIVDTASLAEESTPPPPRLQHMRSFLRQPSARSLRSSRTTIAVSCPINASADNAPAAVRLGSLDVVVLRAEGLSPSTPSEVYCHLSIRGFEAVCTTTSVGVPVDDAGALVPSVPEEFQYSHACGQIFLPFKRTQIGSAFACPGCHTDFVLPPPPFECHPGAIEWNARTSLSNALAGVGGPLPEHPVIVCKLIDREGLTLADSELACHLFAIDEPASRTLSLLVGDSFHGTLDVTVTPRPYRTPVAEPAVAQAPVQATVWEEVDLVIVEAANLPPDVYIDGTADPFVEVSLGGATHTTKVSESAQNPIWDEAFTFAFDPASGSEVVLLVKDKVMDGQPIADTLVGEARLPLSDLPMFQMADMMLPVVFKMKDAGSIRVQATRRVAGEEVPLSVALGVEIRSATVALPAGATSVLLPPLVARCSVGDRLILNTAAAYDLARPEWHAVADMESFTRPRGDPPILFTVESGHVQGASNVLVGTAAVDPKQLSPGPSSLSLPLIKDGVRMGEIDVVVSPDVTYVLGRIPVYKETPLVIGEVTREKEEHYLTRILAVTHTPIWEEPLAVDCIYANEWNLELGTWKPPPGYPVAPDKRKKKRKKKAEKGGGWVVDTSGTVSQPAMSIHPSPSQAHSMPSRAPVRAGVASDTRTVRAAYVEEIVEDEGVPAITHLQAAYHYRAQLTSMDGDGVQLPGHVENEGRQRSSKRFRITHDAEHNDAPLCTPSSERTMPLPRSGQQSGQDDVRHEPLVFSVVFNDTASEDSVQSRVRDSASKERLKELEKGWSSSTKVHRGEHSAAPSTLSVEDEAADASGETAVCIVSKASGSTRRAVVLADPCVESIPLHRGRPEWEQPPEIVDAAVAAWGGRTFVFGGRLAVRSLREDNRLGLSDVLWSYSADRMKHRWRRVRTSDAGRPSPRYQCRACVTGSEMLVYGGRVARGSALVEAPTILHSLNLKTMRWAVVATAGPAPPVLGPEGRPLSLQTVGKTVRVSVPRCSEHDGPRARFVLDLACAPHRWRREPARLFCPSCERHVSEGVSLAT